MSYSLSEIFSLSPRDVAIVLKITNTLPSGTLNGNRALVSMIYYNNEVLNEEDRSIVENPRFYDIMRSTTNIQASIDSMKSPEMKSDEMLYTDLEGVIAEYIPAEQAFVYNKLHPNPKLAKQSVGITDDQAMKYAAENGWIEGLQYYDEMKLLNLNVALYNAALVGCIPTMEWLASRGVTEWSFGLSIASLNGHLGAMKWLVNQATDSKTPMEWDVSLNNAAQGGHVLAMEYLVACGANNFEPALMNASLGGHVEAIQWLAERMVNVPPLVWDQVLFNASTGGHIPAMALAAERGANRWNVALTGASRNGQISAMVWLVERGANDWDPCFISAASGGSILAMQWSIARIVGNGEVPRWNYALINAASGGHIEAMEWLLTQGADRNIDTLNDVFDGAASGGSILAMQWLVDHGVTDLNRGFTSAAYGGSIPTMEWLTSRAARSNYELSFNDALIGAVSNEGVEHIPAMEWLVARGANNLNDALETAMTNNHQESIAWLTARGARV